MNSEEIIDMAREAELAYDIDAVFTFKGNFAQIEAFAKLVAAKAFQSGYEKGIAAFNEAVNLEREACAKVCETHGVHPALNVWNGGPDWYKHGKDCAAVIRARGEA
jgi:hypothetical protein